MTRNDLWAVLTVGILFLAGCGGWSAPAPVAETPGQAKPVAVQLQPTAGDDAPTRELPPSSATPETVVAAFLHAARSGDEATATHLLTDKARRETEKEALALDPPGTPTMKFQIGNVEKGNPS